MSNTPMNNGSTNNLSKAKLADIETLKEMFFGQIEDDSVFQIVYEECGYSIDAAVNKLLEITDPQHPPVSIQRSFIRTSPQELEDEQLAYAIALQLAEEETMIYNAHKQRNENSGPAATAISFFSPAQGGSLQSSSGNSGSTGDLGGRIKKTFQDINEATAKKAKELYQKLSMPKLNTGKAPEHSLLLVDDEMDTTEFSPSTENEGNNASFVLSSNTDSLSQLQTTPKHVYLSERKEEITSQAQDEQPSSPFQESLPSTDGSHDNRHRNTFDSHENAKYASVSRHYSNSNTYSHHGSHYSRDHSRSPYESRRNSSYSQPSSAYSDRRPYYDDDYSRSDNRGYSKETEYSKETQSRGRSIERRTRIIVPRASSIPDFRLVYDPELDGQNTADPQRKKKVIIQKTGEGSHYFPIQDPRVSNGLFQKSSGPQSRGEPIKEFEPCIMQVDSSWTLPFLPPPAIFVSGLPQTMTMDSVRNYFAAHARVKHLSLINSPFDNSFTGKARIVFRHQEADKRLLVRAETAAKFGRDLTKTLDGITVFGFLIHVFYDPYGYRYTHEKSLLATSYRLSRPPSRTSSRSSAKVEDKIDERYHDRRDSRISSSSRYNRDSRSHLDRTPSPSEKDKRSDYHRRDSIYDKETTRVSPTAYDEDRYRKPTDVYSRSKISTPHSTLDSWRDNQKFDNYALTSKKPSLLIPTSYLPLKTITNEHMRAHFHDFKPTRVMHDEFNWTVEFEDEEECLKCVKKIDGTLINGHSFRFSTQNINPKKLEKKADYLAENSLGKQDKKNDENHDSVKRHINFQHVNDLMNYAYRSIFNDLTNSLIKDVTHRILPPFLKNKVDSIMMDAASKKIYEKEEIKESLNSSSTEPVHVEKYQKNGVFDLFSLPVFKKRSLTSLSEDLPEKAKKRKLKQKLEDDDSIEEPLVDMMEQSTHDNRASDLLEQNFPTPMQEIENMESESKTNSKRKKDKLKKEKKEKKDKRKEKEKKKARKKKNFFHQDNEEGEDVDIETINTDANRKDKIENDDEKKFDEYLIVDEPLFDTVYELVSKLPHVDSCDNNVDDFELDDEDVMYITLALESLSYSPPKEQVELFRRHETGSARSDKFHKIKRAEKSLYLAHRNKAIVQESVENTKQTIGPKASSRRTRIDHRSLLATNSDVIKFNQLKARKKRIKFAQSSIHDWGLIALEKIETGDMVIEYVGELIRQKVADHREQRYERMGIGSSYLFRVDEDEIIDATKMGNMARFINHCCEPNCIAKVISFGNEKKIVIYAKEDIGIGDEITYDYKFPIENEKIPCLCGAPGCRGTLN